MLAAVVGLTTVGSPALAADGTSDTHCVTVIDGVKAGEKVSGVRSHTCFTGAGAAAQAKSAAPSAAAATELMIWSEHSSWGGVYDRIYGYDGNCDATGYAFNPSTWWSNNLSSFQVLSGCNKSYLSGPRGNGSFTGNVSYVGNTLNDAVTYIKVWNG
ncbi:hypothetical protein [Streptomyces sp. SID12488]|uniref:hypothetical protein n=1 Tax=Streptomyces sp. SID12488 TaxID=2706040 RepID=UPI0013D98CF0|nr:hypothetical protein [Streptomyces sp. SID12488]NEA64246.1 hypothetical protein [Streptomyces sp. SID12488]